MKLEKVEFIVELLTEDGFWIQRGLPYEKKEDAINAALTRTTFTMRVVERIVITTERTIWDSRDDA